MKPRSKTLIFILDWWRPVLATSAALLVTIEVVLRLMVVPTWPPVESEFAHRDRNCFRPVPGSSITYHRSGILSEPTVHAVNDLGFRGRVPTVADHFRIAVVGGSIAYGTGVSEDETIPATLESILDEKFPEAGISVFNLGFPGFNLTEQSAEFRRLQKTLSPDMVIILLSGDYSNSTSCSRAALPIRNAVRRVSAIWNLMESNIEDSLLNAAKMFSLPAREYPVKVVLGRFDRPGMEKLLVKLAATPPVSTDTGTPLPFDDLSREAGFDILDMSPDALSHDGNGHVIMTEDDLMGGSIRAVAQGIADRIEPLIAMKTQVPGQSP